jgi:hypothetical protein
MNMSKGISVLVLMMAPTLSQASEDRTIWLQPGHCIVVGGQQVCAAKGDSASSPNTPMNKQTHVCKNGIQDEADANLKGWAHVVITTSPEGKKLAQETIKTYGPVGKKDCEADVAAQK